MKRCIAGILISCIIYYGTQCIIVGSNTAVSIQATPFFPTSGNADNEMRGFAAFTSGFTLEASTTTCLFTSQFPVDSSLTFNGGTLNLGINCTLSSASAIYGAGVINGNNYTLTTPALNSTYAPSSATFFQPITNATAGSVVNGVDWSFDDLYVAAAINATAGTELNIYSLSGGVLTLVASATIARNALAVKWNPSNYFLVVGITGGGGNNFLVYQFTPPSTLTLTGGNAVGGGTVQAVSWRPDGAFAAASSTVNAQEANVYGISGAGVVTTSALLDISPHIVPQHNTVSWHPSGNFFTIGGNTAPNYLTVCSFNGTTVAQATTFNTGATVSAVDWSKTNSLIVVGLTGGTSNIELFSFNTTTSVITQITSGTIADANGINAIQWSQDGTQIAVARAAGTAAPLGLYNYNSLTQTFTAGQQIGTPNTLNALRWSHDGNYIATGDSVNIVQIYQKTTPANFSFQNITLDVQSNMQLLVPYVFKGTCILDLNNNTLDCTSASITVTSGATLTIRNGIVSGLSDGRFTCFDGTGTLVLDNVECIEAANLTFGQGALTINNDVQMTGGFAFTYTSARTLTINANSTFAFDTGMTFSYAPGSGGSNSLISMADQSSKLHLYETTLHAPSTGLRFTKGTVVAEGECPVVSRGVTQANGILFGDGLSAANNATLKILAESTFHLLSGFILYQDL